MEKRWRQYNLIVIILSVCITWTIFYLWPIVGWFTSLPVAILLTPIIAIIWGEYDNKKGTPWPGSRRTWFGSLLN